MILRPLWGRDAYGDVFRGYRLRLNPWPISASPPGCLIALCSARRSTPADADSFPSTLNPQLFSVAPPRFPVLRSGMKDNGTESCAPPGRNEAGVAGPVGAHLLRSRLPTGYIHWPLLGRGTRSDIRRLLLNSGKIRASLRRLLRGLRLADAVELLGLLGNLHVEIHVVKGHGGDVGGQ